MANGIHSYIWYFSSIPEEKLIDDLVEAPVGTFIISGLAQKCFLFYCVEDVENLENVCVVCRESIQFDREGRILLEGAWYDSIDKIQNTYSQVHQQYRCLKWSYNSYKYCRDNASHEPTEKARQYVIQAPESKVAEVREEVLAAPDGTFAIVDVIPEQVEVTINFSSVLPGDLVSVKIGLPKQEFVLILSFEDKTICARRQQDVSMCPLKFFGEKILLGPSCSYMYDSMEDLERDLRLMNSLVSYRKHLAERRPDSKMIDQLSSPSPQPKNVVPYYSRLKATVEDAEWFRPDSHSALQDWHDADRAFFRVIPGSETNSYSVLYKRNGDLVTHPFYLNLGSNSFRAFVLGSFEEYFSFEELVDVLLPPLVTFTANRPQAPDRGANRLAYALNQI